MKNLLCVHFFLAEDKTNFHKRGRGGGGYINNVNFAKKGNKKKGTLAPQTFTWTALERQSPVSGQARFKDLCLDVDVRYVWVSLNNKMCSFKKYILLVYSA